PNLEFEYGDADGHGAELAELYSYTEEPELSHNRRCFEEDFHTQVPGRRWLELDAAQQKAYVMRLLDGLEVVNRDKRLRVARAILYLAQGVFGDCDNEGDVLHWSRHNSFLLYQLGTFSAFLELLNMEIENSQACSSALRKPAISLADSTELRYPLGAGSRNFYSGTVLPQPGCSPPFNPTTTALLNARQTVPSGMSVGRGCGMGEKYGELTTAVVGTFPALPARLQSRREPLKHLSGLPWTLSSSSRSCCCVPRAGAALQVGSHLRGHRGRFPPPLLPTLGSAQDWGIFGLSLHVPLMKQDSLDIYNERDPFKNDEGGVDEEENDDVDSGIEGELDLMERDAIIPAMPAQRLPIERVSFPKGLPWAPKVRQKDIEHFLEASRNKFIGFTLGQDTETLIGLPRPIHESVKTLKQHKYVSISDVQIKNEEELEKCPMSLGEEEVQETPCEVLYRAMLYSLPQYMIALLKILLAAAPTSKAKTDSINILADVLPEEMPITVLQSMKLGIDVNRHKEIIVKSISALLLLLLKHFKLNHIYQFEYVSQHLVFANCIPLILKFFNQNIMSYITAKNSISVLDYPHCTVCDLPELTAESLEAGDNNQFCWRNLFSCINLLRILNKLTKWKHSRTMMLVVFKSAPILKRALKVKQAMMQLYVLKLLKIQTKYLGRQWRKSNMKTMSAIYQKVRHRMNDDWAYGNDIDARPWDFQAEECTLRANIEAFNSRRYDKPQDSEFAPVDNCLQSVLGQRLELPEDFHYSYELWLEREVFSQPIRWEELLH
ncbi:Striatin-interacting protein 2, partial [Corvus brachyrhynchos]